MNIYQSQKGLNYFEHLRNLQSFSRCHQDQDCQHAYSRIYSNSQDKMAETLYKDIRGTAADSNPFTDFRPSGWTRIVKGTFETTMFATLLSYGFTFNGYGIHTYYLQTVGTIPRSAPWKRVSTIGSLLPRYIALTLPFFYFKEVAYGSINNFTRDKPQFRSYLNYAYMNNLLSTVACFPIFYLLSSRNVKTAARGSLLLCAFSMANDVFIEYRRKLMMQSKYTQKELKQMKAKKRIREFKDRLNETLLDKNADIREKRKIKQLDFQGLERTFAKGNMEEDQQELDEKRQKELQELGKLVQEELKFLKGILL